MKYWISLICGISLLLVSFWTLFYGYMPKVGVIGDGPNYTLVWYEFSILFISGILILSLSFNFKNKKLRLAWIIPNVFCYLIVITLSTFVIENFEGMKEINRLTIWVVANVALLIISVFGSFRIWNWIKTRKI
ncbi:hypothetical protein V7056_19540 [Bacillus sp. JJ664]